VKRISGDLLHRFVFGLCLCLSLFCTSGTAQTSPPNQFELNDSHFHLTNYVQEGTDIHDFLKIMGTKVGRVALFGIPLQQQWSYQNSGDIAPTYYLQTDSPLYYYSFTDANIAMAYRSLSKEDQARFEPMITGFNPTDMYAADRALDKILDFAGEVGLVVIIHSDMDVPFPKEGAPPAYLDQMKALLRRHPNTTIIWAHTGLGRVVRPIKDHAANLALILSDPAFKHVYFDISWDEVAKYIVATPESTQVSADLINRFPDRFLFGTDEVAPSSQQSYLKVFYQYEPLWKLLSPEASEKVRKGNFAHLFDEARPKVRTWEDSHPRGK